MGEVISFRRASLAPWLRAARLIWDDPSHWSVSEEGWPYVCFKGCWAQVYQRGDHWAWGLGERGCTTAQAHWSRTEFDTEQAARDAAWQALVMWGEAARIVVLVGEEGTTR